MNRGSNRSKKFSNTNPEHRRPSGRDLWRWAVLDRLTGRRRAAPPGPPAPRVEPDLHRISGTHVEPHATWIGHASFLVAIHGTRVLIDPVFSRRIGIKYKRHVRPGLLAGQLPPLDAVLVTHSHYDHLDAASIKALPRDVPMVVPRGLGRWFLRRGFARVTELGWWESAQLGALTITLVPSRHWSQRSLLDHNRTLWGGFVVQNHDVSIYHCGDSAWFDGFAEIGRRFPDLLAALMPIGGYQPGWFMERNHMTPEQAGDAFLQLGARSFVPMHYGTFQMTDEPLLEPLGRLRAWWDDNVNDDHRRLIAPHVGQTVSLA